MSLSAEEKLRVAHVLDELGVPLVEAGFPASNPKEAELFELLARETFRTAEIAAFGMTRRRDVAAEDDEALRLLAGLVRAGLHAGRQDLGLHLEKVVRVGRDENLRMIADSVAFLVREGKRVVYDCEHFFDAWRDDADYALRCVARGSRGRRRVGDAVRHERRARSRTTCRRRPRRSSPRSPRRSASTATTTPSAAWRTRSRRCAPARRMVQGTMNGYGERCGNANLVSIVPNLQLKMGHECLPDLSGLTEASHYLDELLNFVPDPNRPYVGANAFAHKGGMHVAGVAADPATFEHIDPAAVGNAREVLISELSGKGTCSSAPRRPASSSTRARPRGSSSASSSSSTRASTSRPPTARSTC